MSGSFSWIFPLEQPTVIWPAVLWSLMGGGNLESLKDGSLCGKDCWTRQNALICVSLRLH